MDEFVNQLYILDKDNNKIILTWRKSQVKKHTYVNLKPAYKNADLETIYTSHKIKLRYVEYNNDQVIRTRSMRLPGLIRDLHEINKYNIKSKIDRNLNYFIDNFLTDRLVKIESLKNFYLNGKKVSKNDLFTMSQVDVKDKIVYTDFKGKFSKKVQDLGKNNEFRDLNDLENIESSLQPIVVLNGYVPISKIMQFIDYDAQFYDVNDFLVVLAGSNKVTDLNNLYRTTEISSEYIYQILHNHFSNRWRRNILHNILDPSNETFSDSEKLIDKIFENGGTELICSALKEAARFENSMLVPFAEKVVSDKYNYNSEFSDAIKKYANFYLVRLNKSKSDIMNFKHNYFSNKPEKNTYTDIEWLVSVFDSETYEWWAALIQIADENSTRLYSIKAIDAISGYGTHEFFNSFTSMMKNLWKQFEITLEYRIFEMMIPTIFIKDYRLSNKNGSYVRNKVMNYFYKNYENLPRSTIKSLFDVAFHYYTSNTYLPYYGIGMKDLFKIVTRFSLELWRTREEEIVDVIIKKYDKIKLLIFGISNLEQLYNLVYKKLNHISANSLLEDIDYHIYDLNRIYPNYMIDDKSLQWDDVKEKYTPLIKEKQWSKIDLDSIPMIPLRANIVIEILKIVAQDILAEPIDPNRIEEYQVYALNNTYNLMEKWTALSLGNPVDDIIFIKILTSMSFNYFYDDVERQRVQTFIENYISGKGQDDMEKLADLYISVVLQELKDDRIEDFDLDYSHYNLPDMLDFMLPGWTEQHVLRLLENENIYGAMKMANAIIAKKEMVSLEFLSYAEKFFKENKHQKFNRMIVFSTLEEYPDNDVCIQLFILNIIYHGNVDPLEGYMEKYPQIKEKSLIYAINIFGVHMFARDVNDIIGKILLKFDKSELIKYSSNIHVAYTREEGLGSLIFALLYYMINFDNIDIIKLSKIANNNDKKVRKLFRDIISPIILENRFIGLLIPYFESYFEDVNNNGRDILNQLQLSRKELINLYTIMIDSSEPHTQITSLQELFKLDKEEPLDKMLVHRIMEHPNLDVKIELVPLLYSRYEDILLNNEKEVDLDVLENYLKSILFVPNKFRGAKNNIYKLLELIHSQIPEFQDKIKELLYEIASSSVITDRESAMSVLVQLEEKL